jgi:hypothetical protein
MKIQLLLFYHDMFSKLYFPDILYMIYDFYVFTRDIVLLYLILGLFCVR